MRCRSLPVVASLLALANPIPAQSNAALDLSGSWMLTGTDATEDRNEYEGRVEIKREKHLVVDALSPAREVDTYRLKWEFPGNDKPLYGMGVLLDDVLYVSYTDEKNFFLELYFPWEMSESQRETFHAVKRLEAENPDKYVKNAPWFYHVAETSAYLGLWFTYDGDYGVLGWTGASLVGTHKYRLGEVNDKYEWSKMPNARTYTESGTLTVEQTGQNYVFRFSEGPDYSYSGVAFRAPDVPWLGGGPLLIGGMGGKETAGVSYYRFTSSGLEGVWAQQGGERRGTEILTAPEVVRKRASGHFSD
jgi:hypothetical protein